jgi:2-polyprenyl-3-methyl-5-hydroxy-6-metoxy-1,4-benzoquinol methylase
MLKSIGQNLTALVRPSAPRSELPSEAHLRKLMLRYQTHNLSAPYSASSFKERIEQFLGRKDHRMEGLQDPEKQRTFTVDFHWGHDHDFGSFQIEGRMGDRHIRHLAEFIDRFGAIPRSLEGAQVLDIGCWTGGTSLLLCALGAQVLAIDEVKKYVDCLSYLRDAFSIANLEVQNRSLYELTPNEFQDRFDYVLFAGVLYHVTDPVVALRLTFNCLRDGGKCLIETTGFRHQLQVISYARRKYNWFDFSPSALSQMLADVGYAEIQVGEATRKKRLYAVAQRTTHVDMRRDGLSVPTLR